MVFVTQSGGTTPDLHNLPGIVTVNAGNHDYGGLILQQNTNDTYTGDLPPLLQINNLDQTPVAYIDSTGFLEVDSIYISGGNNQSGLSSTTPGVGLIAGGFVQIKSQLGLRNNTIYVSATSQIYVFTSFVTMVPTSADVTMGATPTIGTNPTYLYDNTLFYLYNRTGHNVTLQDDNNLAGSRLKLKNRANLTIPDDTLVQFLYIKTNDFWKQITDPM